MLKRGLTDGREFTIVKIFYDTDELTNKLNRLGWNAEIATTGELFMYGTATPKS